MPPLSPNNMANTVKTVHNIVSATVAGKSDSVIDHSIDVSCREIDLFIVSFNLHGYNQGFVALKSLIVSKEPHIVLLI